MHFQKSKKQKQKTKNGDFFGFFDILHARCIESLSMKISKINRRFVWVAGWLGGKRGKNTVTSKNS